LLFSPFYTGTDLFLLRHTFPVPVDLSNLTLVSDLSDISAIFLLNCLAKTGSSGSVLDWSPLGFYRLQIALESENS
jgi:hypothetical protein